MNSFQLQAEMYNSITPSEIETKDLKERLKELETENEQLREERKFLISQISDAESTIVELLNRIYAMQAREKIQEHLIPVSERLPESRISYLRGDKV